MGWWGSESTRCGGPVRLSLRHLTARSHQRLLSNKLAPGPRSGTGDCVPVEGTCASCQSTAGNKEASNPSHCFIPPSPHTGSAQVRRAAKSSTSREMKDEEEHRLFKDGCVIVHIIYNFITVSQAEVFITLVQDEPQSGWEIAVYSLGVWREKKKKGGSCNASSRNSKEREEQNDSQWLHGKSDDASKTKWCNASCGDGGVLLSICHSDIKKKAVNRNVFSCRETFFHPF